MNNPFKTQDELIEFNNKLMEEVKTLSTSKNYITYITMPGRKVEIYGYLKKDKPRMFGLKPCYGTKYIKKLMFDGDKNNSPFGSKDSFVNYIKNNDSLFGNLGATSRVVKRGLWGRILLNASRFFMTTIYFQNINFLYCFKDIILNILSPYVELKIDNHEQCICVWGRIPDECLHELDRNVGLVYLDERICAGALQLYKDKWCDLYKKGNEKYTNPSMPVIYSGVIPSLKAIRRKKLDYVNSGTEYLQFKVIKTTYFTMDGLENTVLNDHPFLKDYRIELRKFDECELKMAENAAVGIKNSKCIDETIEIINGYLENSNLTHNVNVCGNVITSDNYCVYTKRHDKIYDANKYYCSANGSCEFKDSEVSFYKIPNVDCPTIEENCREFSFIDELSREAAAELNIYDHVTNVRCLGFSIMANFPDKNFTSQKFVSFFFNVIGEIKTQSSLENIQNMQKQAQEEFENKLIRGFRVIIIDNSFVNKILKYMIKVIDKLYDKKWIEGILGIFILTGIYNQPQGRVGSMEWIWTIFCCLVILSIIADTFIYMRNYLKLKKNLFVLKRSCSHVAYKVNRIIGRKQEAKNRDSIMVLLSMLHIFSAANERVERGVGQE